MMDSMDQEKRSTYIIILRWKCSLVNKRKINCLHADHHAHHHLRHHHVKSHRPIKQIHLQDYRTFRKLLNRLRVYNLYLHHHDLHRVYLQITNGLININFVENCLVKGLILSVTFGLILVRNHLFVGFVRNLSTN